MPKIAHFAVWGDHDDWYRKKDFIVPGGSGVPALPPCDQLLVLAMMHYDDPESPLHMAPGPFSFRKQKLVQLVGPKNQL